MAWSGGLWLEKHTSLRLRDASFAPVALIAGRGARTGFHVVEARNYALQHCTARGVTVRESGGVEPTPVRSSSEVGTDCGSLMNAVVV